MAEIIINNDYELAHHEPKLRCADDKPCVLGYVRVSTAEQEEEGFSVDNQIDKLRSYCNGKFGDGKYHIIYLIEDASGSLPYDRGGMKRGEYREGLTLATQIIERGYVQHIGVYKMNRLTRNSRVWFELDEDFLQPHNVEVFSTLEPVSNRTAASRFVASVIAATAQNERDNIVSNVRDGMQERAKNLYQMGKPPFGWRWDDARPPRRSRHGRSPSARNSGDAKVRRNIEPDPETSMYVRKAFDWIIAGKTRRWIAEEFTRCAVKRPEGAVRWTAKMIRRILMYPVHAGLVKLDGKLVEGQHYDKRIVDPETYYAALELLDSQIKSGWRMQKSTNHIFGTLVHCGICGSRMLVVPRRGVRKYECRGGNGCDRHDGFGVPVEGVERRIVESIAELAIRTDLLEAASQSIHEIVDAEADDRNRERVRLERQIVEHQGALLRWAERWNSKDPSTERPDRDAMVRDIYKNKLLDEIEECQQRLSEIDDYACRSQARRVEIERAIALLSRFDELWEEMDLNEKRTLAKYLIQELTLTPDDLWVNVRLRLMLAEPIEYRLPRRNRDRSIAEGLDLLTPGDLTLAYYYLRGYTDAEIAAERDIGVATVRNKKRQLLKRVGVSDLEEALKIVEPMVTERKDELLIGSRRSRPAGNGFTWLQVRYLELMAEGKSAPEIAEVLGRPVNTVYCNTSRLYDKLGVSNAKEAVAEARRRNLIPGGHAWSDRPTERQMEVLIRFARGMSQPQIAEELGLSLSAVKERTKCMFTKFNVTSRTDLLRVAAESGWIS